MKQKPQPPSKCPECGAIQWTGRKTPNHFSTCSQYVKP